jgi:hypothetical protein
MGRSISSIISDLQDVVDDLERFDVIADMELEDDGGLAGVIECLTLGLPFIESKYGSSSNEAKKVRDIIERWT